MKRPLLAFALVCVALSGTGCASYSIDPGIWKIEFKVQDARTREPLEFGVWKVRVLVEEALNDLGEAVEDVEIQPLSRHTSDGVEKARNLKPFFGEIVGDTLRLNPKNHDGTYVYDMEGQIIDPGLINGRRIVARDHVKGVATVQGFWRMTRIGNDPSDGFP